MVVQASDNDAAWVRCSELVPPGGHPGADPVEHAGGGGWGERGLGA